MAISTLEVAQTLQTEMGPVGALALQEWLLAQQQALAAISAKLDADTGVGDTDYEATLNTFFTE